MASDGETLCANDPNFAVIYSFLKVFGKLYGLEVPTIAKLQEFIENTQEVSETLKDLHLRLLRRALRTVHSNRWEKGMIKFCHQQGHHQEAWEIERFSYKKASTQVKLKVLKILLEYQFTCHPKFKTAVNAISSKELRLDPIGRDQSGCAYWLQIDNDANLCLYKEDQDEETWQLIARNREELVKVIGQLKSGEEISPSQTSNANEDSSGAENPVQESQTIPSSQPQRPEADEEENEEEFLSPESESEQEIDTEQKENKSDPVDSNDTNVESLDPLDSDDRKVESPEDLENNQTTDDHLTINHIKDTNTSNNESSTETQEESVTESQEEVREPSPSICENHAVDITETNKTISEEQGENIAEINKNAIEKQNEDTNSDTKEIITETQSENISETIEETKDTEKVNNISETILEKEISEEPLCSPNVSENSKDSESVLEDEEHSVSKESKNEESIENVEVSEAIEEPVMHITGEGNGADCESYFIGEEISEPVIYFYGEGYGYDNDAGNSDAIEESNQAESEGENGTEEVVNGEHEVIKTKSKLSKSVRLKNVNKRSLKKQSNDTNDAKPDTKKPCVRNTDKSQNSKTENDLKREASVNDKSTTDSESPRKNNVKKGRSKIKKKAVSRKLKTNGKEAINSVSETDNCQDKTSIIEKRKSSVSSVDHDDSPEETQKEKSPDKDLKLEDPLPTKKLRLETTPDSDNNATHSKDTVSDSIENKDSSNHNSISKRKKIKASKGKFKRKSFVQNKQDLDKSIDSEKVNDSPKKVNKSLKRSLIEDPLSDKNKSESQSESEDNEPITSGKRLKIKPKKIITLSRKKVEAKLLEKQSSDESEEETLYSLAGKKSTKKLMKKKPKTKSKEKKDKPKAQSEKANSDDSDTPVRQSRRIAQQKIKEEAERRHQEEVALRELKMIHKKKGNEDEEEEEWRASGRSSSEARVEIKRKHRRTWHASDSTGPEPDSESDSPLFELQPEPEPEHDYGKSDHEFSPESDLETSDETEPLKRARTLQEEKDEGFCKSCGSGEQPEWILLCDQCDAGYHASCLKPMLFVIPEGEWFCPPCNHDKLISALECELVKYDELLAKVEEERARKKLEEPEKPPEEKKPKSEVESEGSSDSSWSSSSDSAAVYRLRTRRQLPVSYRDQEYDRMISAAIKEEYVEPTTSAGNQGRGKDISTIIEAAEEEKMKAEREAIEQGKPVEVLKKLKKKQRKKPRKLNSLEVPSEDDDETDEDFKDTGAASSSEDISSSADKESCDSRSSDSLPIRRTGRSENKKDRPKMTESSPETKKKKKVFEDSSSESAGAKEWNSTTKSKSKSHSRSKKRDKRDKSRSRKSKKSRGLTQYDAEGNVIRARVTYGGLSEDEGENDWSPKHRTRQKKINYTEMPNTESEDEMHKSSGKHMPDSSDEFKCSDSDLDTDSDSDRTKKRKEEENLEREKALSDLVKKTAVVPLEKLPEDVTKAKTEELEAHLNAQQAAARPSRGKGSRGGRASRGGRGRGGGRGGGRAASPQTDDALAKLIGVKIKELGQDASPIKPNQLEREKKRQEREAKQAEKEAKKLERLQKREEKEKMKEQKAKEREEKRLARLALQESKRIKKEKEYMGPGPGPGMGVYIAPSRPMDGESPRMNNMNMNMFNHMRGPRPGGPPPGLGGPPPGHGGPGEGPEQRFPNTPRLQVRAELRGVLTGEERLLQRHEALREGTLSVAGSPQPFKPVSEEPSIITRMPHNMINQQYRGPMMYPSGSGGYAHGARQYGPGPAYPPHYYRLPPAYPAPPAAGPPRLYRHPLPGNGAAPSGMHHPPGPSLHHSGGYYRALPPGGGGGGTPPPHLAGPHHNSVGPHNMRPPFNRSPGPNPAPAAGPPGPAPITTGLPAVPGTPGAPSMSMARLAGAPAGAPGGGGEGEAGAEAAGPSNTQDQEPPIKIKAEVKTEPEYRSPTASPGASSPPGGGGAGGAGGAEGREEPPRHPKIKVTERRPRYPLGPYAPHLAPYRPYAPGAHLQHHSAPHPHLQHHPVSQPHHHPASHPHHQPTPHPQHQPGPHPLQLRDPSQYMSERTRSPAEGGAESARPFPPRGFPPARMPPPPHYPPPKSPHGPHAQSPHGPHAQSPHGPHTQSPHGPHAQSPHAPPSNSPHAPHPQSPHGQSSPHGQPPHGQNPHLQHLHGQPPQGQVQHLQPSRGQSQQGQLPQARTPHGQPPLGFPPNVRSPHGQSPQEQSHHGPPLHGQPSPGMLPHGRPPHFAPNAHSKVLPPQGASPQGGLPHGAPRQAVPQGFLPHGVPLHGAPPRGVPPQGASPHGIPPQGASPHGIPPQGASSLGIPPQGASSLGIPPQGASSHGIPPQGASPHGIPPQGTSPHGIPPQGGIPHGASLQNVPPHRGSMPFPSGAPPPHLQGNPRAVPPHDSPGSPPPYAMLRPPPGRSPAAERATPPFPLYGERRVPAPPRPRLESLDGPLPDSDPNPDPTEERDESSPTLHPPLLDRVKLEREEGSVFGGLVSYFSSQHEDDMDG